MAIAEVCFVLNGERVSLHGIDPGTTLSEWIRCSAGLTGTKTMCAEGGCGCCVVTGKWKDLASADGLFVTAAVNSCLCPLYSVDGWEVTTVEGIGRAADGYHPVQKRIAQYNGSQCGYCTPGFVMNMYSLLQTSPCPSRHQVEDAFDGNICRCTGYRPILDGMRSFCGVSDIEDLSARGQPRGCFNLGVCASRPRPSAPQWFRASCVADVFTLLEQCRGRRVKLAAGNTGRGVYKDDPAPEVIVDLMHIPQLWRKEVTAAGLVVGACVTLSRLIELLQSNKDRSASFHCLANHLSKIANVPVRNVATWAGNLMLTRNHDNFPSDVYSMMAAAGATVTIATSAEESTSYSLQEFMRVAMDTKLIVSMEIPFLNGDVFRSYKVMPRAQNAHAYVNAGFRLSLDPTSLIVRGVPSMVFGGLSEHATFATQTANCLVGKVLTDPSTLQIAMATLQQELVPNSPPAAASASYRKSLACSLFYKFYLSCLPRGLDPRVQSAAVPRQRPLSRGQQEYETDPSQYPLTQPLTTLTALQQAAGEALYTTDVPAPPTQLHAAFVLSTEGNARLLSVDPTPALSLPGVVQFVSAKDIPPGGKNNFLLAEFYPTPEEVFAEDMAHYAGQAIGMIIAETQELANKAAGAVSVTYESLGTPILSIKDAIVRESFFRDPDPLVTGEAAEAIASSPCTVSGEVSCGTQYHFTMETQASLVVPEEDGYSVVASTQWIQLAQSAVAQILGVSASSVNVSVKRVGGGYGSKISRSHQITAACALGAYLTRRPVRMHMDLERNMKMVGKRYPYVAHYEVGFNRDGRINGVKLELYNDSGYVDNDQEFDAGFFYGFIDNAYNIPNWLIKGKVCRTHTPCNTWTRSPGSVPAVFIIESVLDHVGKSLGIPQEEVRLVNLYNQDDLTLQCVPLEHCNIRSVWQELLRSAEVCPRQATVEQYNKENRWRKRGMSVVPLKHALGLANMPYTVFVSIYSADGTVAVAHAGVEIGQGINIKVAQAAARTLGVPLEYISVKPSNSLTGPNSFSTGSSTTSELNVLGVVRACEVLRARIDPVRQRMTGEPTWREVVWKCHAQQVDLSAKGHVNEGGVYPHTYFSWGACCVEVELDVLTGEAEVLRADILYDCGQSMNPEIDVGQVEGAFVMGLGYWLMEDIKYHPQTGELLTHNTWEYKVPSSKDIPVDFRVSLLKNAPNPLGVLRSKAVGEPPQCMSCAVVFALKRAIESAREEVGNTDTFSLSGPATAEVLQQKCLVHSSQFTI